MMPMSLEKNDENLKIQWDDNNSLGGGVGGMELGNWNFSIKYNLEF